jgi:hypothetical protein
VIKNYSFFQNKPKKEKERKKDRERERERERERKTGQGKWYNTRLSVTERERSEQLRLASMIVSSELAWATKSIPLSQKQANRKPPTF